MNLILEEICYRMNDKVLFVAKLKVKPNTLSTTSRTIRLRRMRLDVLWLRPESTLFWNTSVLLKCSSISSETRGKENRKQLPVSPERGRRVGCENLAFRFALPRGKTSYFSQHTGETEPFILTHSCLLNSGKLHIKVTTQEEPSVLAKLSKNFYSPLYLE